MIYIILYVLGYLIFAIGFKNPRGSLLWPIPVGAMLISIILDRAIHEWKFWF
jgi:hypothetical protein